MTANDAPHPMSVISMHDSGMTTEQTAAAFARFSRSPESIQENTQETLRSNSEAFHNKWTLDYGHSSIAEHAPVQLAVENISRIVCDLVEEGRLASYTEKSSRFQSFATDQFAAPPELQAHPRLLRRFRNATTAAILDSISAQNDIARHLERTEPGAPNLARRARDASRALLPAAILTSFGYTLNARSLAHAISKLYSHPLAEAHQLADALKNAATKQVPTLLRRAEEDPRLSPHQPAVPLPPPGPYREPRILNYTPDAERIICAAIFHSQGIDPDSAEQRAESLTPDHRDAILHAHLQTAARHGKLPREFELASCRIALSVDYGALRELNRHRLQTNLNQPLQTASGVNMPEAAAQAGLHALFDDAHTRANALYERIHAELGPYVAQYAVLHCHIQHTQVHANLRQLHALLRLRTRENVHPSLRSEMQKALALCHHTYPSIFPRSFQAT